MASGQVPKRLEETIVAIDLKLRAKGSNLPELMAERFYEIHERLIFHRQHFARTSLASKLWKDLKEREVKEYIEAFRELLTDQEVIAMLRHKSEL